MIVRKCVSGYACVRPAWVAAAVIALSCMAGATAGAQTLPSPWASTDIGNPPAAGSATESSGRFTIEASGADIWGTSDQFHFLYQPVTGDVDVRARIDSILNVDAWSKAGVMIRASLTPGSAHAYSLVSAGKGLAFQRRRANGGSSYHTSGGTATAPRWTRLVRKGTTVTAYVSADGVSWTTVGSDTISLGATAYVGIAVTSHASGLTTAVASQVSLTQGSGLPTGYATADVGAVAAQGSATYSNGAFTVLGSGADIWDSQDEFRFVYRQVSGDVDVRARVSSLQYVASWTKAGVMIRESLAANSRHGLSLVSAGKGYAFQRRPDTGAWSENTAGGSGTAPGWVRLVRAGTRVDAYRSADGVTWTLIGTDTISMASTVYVGLAITSHVDGTLAKAVFDNVSIVEQGTSANLTPKVALTSPTSGATFTAPASMTVSASASDSDGQVTRVDFLANNSLIGSDTTSPYSISWSSVPAGSYSLTAVAYDNTGASTSSAAVSISVSAGTNKPPTVSLTSPTSGATFTAPATIAVSANASDPEAAMSRVDFYANGTQIGTDSTAPYSISWGSVPAGSYSITAVARDAAGNSTTSTAVSVTVGSSSTTTKWTVDFTASADHATVTRYVLEVFTSGSDPSTAKPVATSDLGKPTPDANNEIAVDRTTFFNGLAAGNYIATVRAENSTGSSRSTAVSFTR